MLILRSVCVKLLQCTGKVISMSVSNHSAKQSLKRGNKTMNAQDIKADINQIDNHLAAYEYEEALKLSLIVLGKNPNNAKVLEMRATVATEMSDFDTALKYLNKAIVAEPSSGYSKYLAKAQLLSGNYSLESYKKAIEIIKINQQPTSIQSNGAKNNDESMEVESTSPEENIPDESHVNIEEYKEEHSLERDLSSIYCSIAELYLTDLCDESDAESCCTAAIKSAMETDPTNAEAPIVKVCRLKCSAI